MKERRIGKGTHGAGDARPAEVESLLEIVRVDPSVDATFVSERAGHIEMNLHVAEVPVRMKKEHQANKGRRNAQQDSQGTQAPVERGDTECKEGNNQPQLVDEPQRDIGVRPAKQGDGKGPKEGAGGRGHGRREVGRDQGQGQECRPDRHASGEPG